MASAGAFLPLEGGCPGPRDFFSREILKWEGGAVQLSLPPEHSMRWHRSDAVSPLKGAHTSRGVLSGGCDPSCNASRDVRSSLAPCCLSSELRCCPPKPESEIVNTRDPSMPGRYVSAWKSNEMHLDKPNKPQSVRRESEMNACTKSSCASGQHPKHRAYDVCT